MFIFLFGKNNLLMATTEDSVDDLIQQAEEMESENEEEDSSDAPPPKKKRKLDAKGRSKSKKSKKHAPEPIEDVEVALTDEEIALDSVRRKELRKIKLMHPSLDISQVYQVTEEINAMTPQDVVNILESSKVTLGLQRPLAEAENVVGLMALAAQRYFPDCRDLYSRFISDSELIAAVDEFVPRMNEQITGPLGILRRAAGHISDSSSGQNNFSNLSSRISQEK